MKKKIASLMIAALVVASVFTGCGSKFEIAEEDFTLELGDAPEKYKDSYITVKDTKIINDITFDFSKVESMKVGIYDATASLDDVTKSFKIKVEDSTAPVITVNDCIVVSEGTPVKVNDIIESVVELSGNAEVSFREHTYTEENETGSIMENVESTETSEIVETETREEVPETILIGDVELNNIAVVYGDAGEYDNTMTVTDSSGNKAEIPFHVTVIKIPEIYGVEDFIAEKGSDIDYFYAVTATDGEESDISSDIQIDSSEVDMNVPGEYEITYAVTDKNGFSTSLTAKVTVTEDIEKAITTEDGNTKKVVTSSGTGTIEEKKQELEEKRKAEAERAAQEQARKDAEAAAKKAAEEEAARQQAIKDREAKEAADAASAAAAQKEAQQQAQQESGGSSSGSEFGPDLSGGSFDEEFVADFQ